MCSTQIFIFVSFCISFVICNKLCNIDDNKCMTNSADRNYLEIINGMPGVRTSDPLHLDFLEANLPTIKYKLFNASLSGMKKCHMELLQFSPDIKKYYAHIGCPHLVFESQYETEGYLGPEYVEGKGTCRIDYYDYNLLFNGEYERNNYNDRKIHIHLKNYNVETEAKGKVHYDMKNLFNGDKVKSDALHEFLNENWQFVDKVVSQPTFDAFMEKHIENVNGFFKEVSFEDVFTY